MVSAVSGPAVSSSVCVRGNRERACVLARRTLPAHLTCILSSWGDILKDSRCNSARHHAEQHVTESEQMKVDLCCCVVQRYLSDRAHNNAFSYFLDNNVVLESQNCPGLRWMEIHNNVFTLYKLVTVNEIE